jgi:hypothetical protein
MFVRLNVVFDPLQGTRHEKLCHAAVGVGRSWPPSGTRDAGV